MTDANDTSCSAAMIPGCAQSKLLSEHSKAIDAAHAKLRDHEVDIAQLQMQGGSCMTRLERGEQAQHENPRRLVRLDAGLSHVETALKTVTATSESTHALLSNHISDSMTKEEQRSRALLEREELLQKRLIRITGAVGAILILAALIHSAVTGQSVWTVLGGVIG